MLCFLSYNPKVRIHKLIAFSLFLRKDCSFISSLSVLFYILFWAFPFFVAINFSQYISFTVFMVVPSEQMFLYHLSWVLPRSSSSVAVLNPVRNGHQGVFKSFCALLCFRFCYHYVMCSFRSAFKLFSRS